MGNDGSESSVTKQPLLGQILQWSEQSLPTWQRDALRRLFKCGFDGLAHGDLDELYDLLKQSNGLDGKSVIEPKAWSKEHLPDAASSGDHVVLRAMRDLKNVNRIPASQSLSFAREGMTIVYGGNGSGKSGFSRVLKRACRARDQGEPIHPDVTKPSQGGGIPEAQFDLEIKNQVVSVTWKLDGSSPDELASIAVFDAKCARAYLTTEGEVAYIPYGLDVLADLATKLLPSLDKRLGDEIASLDVDLSILDSLRGPTKVGTLVAKFGPSTSESEIDTLGTMSDADVVRLAELQKVLSEEDPLSGAKKTRLEGQRLSDLAERIGASCERLTGDALDTLKKTVAESIEAEKFVASAADALRSGDKLLPGTGENLWRQMYEAARRFSVEAAYPGHPFPHVAEGSVCPLCQQSIDEVDDRLNRFEAYVQQESAKNAEKAKRVLSDTVEALRKANWNFRPDDALGAELALHDPGLPVRIEAFHKCVVERARSFVSCAATAEWSEVATLGGDPRKELLERAQALIAKAETLEKAADLEKRKVLSSEREELTARAKLKIERNRVLKLLASLKRKAGLEACKKDLKTNAISTKAKAFAESAITLALRDALDQEFKKLGGVPFELKLADRSDKGKTKYRLQLAFTTVAKLDEILSEGEQRAVAMGSFLAELALAGHKGGIVLDDPVSSLDHTRKEHIAIRLAEEAKSRQVIVFTHDLVFLAQLQAELARVAAECCTHWLEQDNDGCPGKVRLDDSPTGSAAYRDTKLGRGSIAKAEGLGGEERVGALRVAAGQFRRTLEEIVQKHLLKDVVVRWRENLMLTKLPSVQWQDAVADEICEVFERLSRYIEGHSHTEQYTGAPPTVEELKLLADRVDVVIKAAKPERKKSVGGSAVAVP